MNKTQALIASHEGLRLRMYLDTADPPKFTIGYGHNIEDNGISQAVANLIFYEDVETARSECREFAWFGSLDEVRAAVVINMVFNMGMPTFKEFKKTIGYIEANDYEAAAIEMLDSVWSRQVGYRSEQLSEMMRTGKWQ